MLIEWQVTFDGTFSPIVAAFRRVWKTAVFEALPIDGPFILIIVEHNVRVVVDLWRNDRFELERVRIQVVQVEYTHSLAVRVDYHFTSHS